MTNITANIQLLSDRVDWSSRITAALVAEGQPAETIFSYEDATKLFDGKCPNAAVLIVYLTGNEETTSSLLSDYGRKPEMVDTVIILVSPTDKIEENRVLTQDLGAFHLTQSMQIENLVAIIQTARVDYLSRASLRDEVSRRKSAIGHIVSGSFELKTLEEARNLSTMLSLAYPVSEDVAIGILELIINGIEHGNLELGSDEKSDLLARNKLHDEIDRRLNMKPYGDRKIVVDFDRQADRILLRITDEGKGFNFKKYMKRQAVSPLASHGRGIFLTRELCFSEIKFVGKGNIVNAIYELND